MGNYLGRAGAYEVHKKYPAGSQTASQLAAERLNLQKARAARGQMRHTKSVPYHGHRRSTAKSRESSASRRSYGYAEIAFEHTHPLGVRFMRYEAKAKMRKLRVSGIPKKFKKQLSPGRYMGRTAWGTPRKGSFKKRLFKRSHRMKQLSHWKYRGKRYTPR